MKKKGLIIASLLILAMSVVFLGCPPPEEEEKDVLLTDSTAIAALQAIGHSGTLKAPKDATYDGCNKTTDNDVIIAWTGGTADIFDAYAKKLGARITYTESAELTEANLGTGFEGKVYYCAPGGTDFGYTVKANSIVVTVWAK